MPGQTHLGGTIGLLPYGSGYRAGWMDANEFTYYGVYSADLANVQAKPPDTDPLPLAGARMVGADSVEVVLNPTVDHGAVMLWGRTHGDSIRGRWETTGYAPGASGRFVMVREHP
jgi:hypothetical protein